LSPLQAHEFDTILTTVKGFSNWANIELIETILYPNDNNELDGVRNNEKRMTQAFEIGVRISTQKASLLNLDQFSSIQL
jgi:hypothetical protein